MPTFFFNRHTIRSKRGKLKCKTLDSIPCLVRDVIALMERHPELVCIDVQRIDVDGSDLVMRHIKTPGGEE